MEAKRMAGSARAPPTSMVKKNGIIGYPIIIGYPRYPIIIGYPISDT
jgi:hypothetical protein